MAENSRRWAEISRRYRTYIKLEKRLSANTVESYMRDLEQFAHFVLRMWDVPPRKVESQMIERYMAWLYDRGCEKSSQARALSGLKSFFNYLLLTDAIESSPLEFIEMPKFSRRLPDVLSTAEIDRILAAIDRTTPKGVRDDAMLELRVQNPPVAMVENELQTASNQPIPTIFSSTVWISVNPT